MTEEIGRISFFLAAARHTADRNTARQRCKLYDRQLQDRGTNAMSSRPRAFSLSVRDLCYLCQTCGHDMARSEMQDVGAIDSSSLFATPAMLCFFVPCSSFFLNALPKVIQVSPVHRQGMPARMKLMHTLFTFGTFSIVFRLSTRSTLTLEMSRK